jgi:hypothetical protein
MPTGDLSRMASTLLRHMNSPFIIDRVKSREHRYRPATEVEITEETGGLATPEATCYVFCNWGVLVSGGHHP